MLEFSLTGTQLEITAALVAIAPEVGTVLERIDRGMKRYRKREIRNFEAAFLYVLAKQYDYDGAEMFEIGTCYGWSTLVMAHAAPRAHIVTCTPNASHIEAARLNFAAYPRLEVRPARSVDLLADYRGPALDLLFVDGDHKAVAQDIPWYNRLKTGGLMVHHDYSAADALERPCRWVWDALNEFAERMHPFDVMIMDDNRTGMAGWYRREGETWLTKT